MSCNKLSPDHYNLIRQYVPTLQDGGKDFLVWLTVFYAGAAQANIQIGTKAQIVDGALKDAVTIIIRHNGDLVMLSVQMFQQLAPPGLSCQAVISGA